MEKKKYKRVVLDFETTGLDYTKDEILQVSIIDESGNTLINEYCKPKGIKEWKEAQQIHGISPELVKDKKTFEYYSEIVKEILNNTETIIIYNADFEIDFLEKYNIVITSNVYDLMLAFAEVYGDWNDYFTSYTWKSLSECCRYYGYYINKAHDSLEDCKATLYCYNKLISNEGRYEASEHVGKTLREFINDVQKIVGDAEISLYIRNEYISDEENNLKKRTVYLDECIKDVDDIKYQTLLDCKILNIDFYEFKYYFLSVEKCIEAEIDIKDKKIEKLKKELEETEKRIDGKNSEIRNLKNKISRLEKKNLKLEQDLGLTDKPKIDKFNSYGYYTAEYCRTTKKPMFKDRYEYEPFADKLLSKSRCKQVKMQVKDNEEIYAFYKVQHGYCALYFRDIKENENA